MGKSTSKYIIVTDKPKLFDVNESQVSVTPHEFITKNTGGVVLKRGVRIINLSNNYDYLSNGYYVSLLAQARGLQCIPSVSSLVSLNWRRNYTLSFSDINGVLEKNFDLPYEEPLTRTYTSFLGRHENSKLEPVTRKIFDIFRLPIVTFEIKYVSKGKWHINRLSSVSFNTLSSEQIDKFKADLATFTGAAWKSNPKSAQERYWLAILQNPLEKNAPSNPQALKKFMDVGKKMGIWSELITKDDYSSLLEYDALFIRETTAINHHTYRFSKKAELEGIPSIDDTDSIIKCCNKVYLNELMETHKIDRPLSGILTLKTLESKLDAISLPAVLKIPDGCFSHGVLKVSTKDELRSKATDLLHKSEIILCQEFLPSKFDWRIGILNHKPLYASKYYMAEGHWQIVNHGAKKSSKRYGMDEAVSLDKVPEKVLKVAIKATDFIGDSLYGVDIKELEDGRVVLIEVNDNPNIDRGVEDKLLGDKLYQMILEHIVMKIEQ